MPVVHNRHDTEYEHLLPLLRRLADQSLSEDARRRIREEVVAGHLPLAEHIAQRYQRRGQSIEDLRQVAMIGLLGAVDRFDPERGSDFVSFAVPTIVGEVRRYFRDATWVISVPRRLKELNRSIAKVVAELTTESGQSPRPQQIATRLGISLEAVYEGLQVGMAYHADSLDTRGSGQEDDYHPDWLGSLDPGLDRIEDRQTLRSALAELPDREAAIVRLRFFDD